MKKSIDDILVKVKPVWQKARRYKGMIFLIILLFIYAFLIFQVNILSNQNPDDTKVSEKLQTVTRPHLDQSTIDKINDLQDNSVQVKSLFNSARKNPFQE